MSKGFRRLGNARRTDGIVRVVRSVALCQLGDRAGSNEAGSQKGEPCLLEGRPHDERVLWFF